MWNEKLKRNLYQSLKILISLGMIGVILLKTDFGNLLNVLRSVQIGYLVLAAGLMFMEMISMTYRMNYLFALKGMILSFGDMMKFNMMGVFVGNFLPSKLGVDGLRMYYLAKHTNQTVDSITSIALDRFVNIIVITFFASMSYLFGGYYRTVPALGLIILLMISGIAFVLLMMNHKLSRHFEKYLTRRKWSEKIVQFIRDLTVSFKQFRHHPRQLFVILFLGTLFQLNRILTTYFFTRAVHVDVNITYFFLVTPMMIILGMLPFSVAGLGITQYSAVQMFGMVGVPVESSLGFSMLIYFSRILIAMPGLYFFHKEGLDSLMDSLSKIGSGFSRRKKDAE